MKRERRLGWRVLRTGILIVVLVLAGARILPRLVSEAVKDEIFMRQDFTYAAKYRVGGLEAGGRHFGGRSIDCVGLEQPLPRTGVNLLANPHLDDPCGWIFVPFLGGKERKSDARGGYLCVDHGKDVIFQEVRLHPLAEDVDGGALDVTLSVLLRTSPEAPAGSLSLFAEDGAGRRVGMLTLSPRRERSRMAGTDWQPLSADWAVPPGTRRLRLTLTSGTGEPGVSGRTACFDDPSLVLRDDHPADRKNVTSFP